MFVRFREYELAKGGTTLYCEVVESFRDKLRPDRVRQRSVCYLGSIKQSWLKYPRARVEFLKRVEEKLSHLPLGDSEAHKILFAVERRITPEVAAPPQQGSVQKVSESVQSQTQSSSPAAEPTAEELLADLQRRLGVNV